jgi:hypothetical protein
VLAKLLGHGWISRLSRGLALLLLALALALPAAAQTPVQVPVDVQINILIEQGDYAAALALAERAWGPETPNRAARIDFIRGMKLKAEGDLQGAIAIFRKLLADNPGFTRVRVELASALYQAGDPEAASYHLRDLARTAQTDELRRNFESYLDAIKRDRPWRVGGYLSLAPSTNVNGRTTERVIVIDNCPFDPSGRCQFVIDEGSRAASGIGLTGGLSGERHFFLSDDITVTLSGRVDAIKYIDPQFDRLSGRAGAHVRKKLGDTTIGGGVVADYSMIGWQPYRDAAGFEFEVGRAMGPATHLLLSTSIMYQRFAAFPTMNGPAVSLGAVVGHAIGPGQSLTTGMSFTLERTSASYLDSDALRTFVGYGKEWNGGLITYVEPSITLRRFRGIDPSFGSRREDIEVGARVGLSHRKLSFWGFMPRLEYSYTRQFSTHTFQRRETHSANVVLTREF